MDTFDWQEYINNNSDLKEAGIDNELDAMRHFLNHGISEKRYYGDAFLSSKIIPALKPPNVDANVSIVLGCKNRERMLNISIHSWLYYPEVKEIIITDWSSDNPISYLEKIDPRIKVIRVEGEQYYNASTPVNMAIKKATNPIIMKLDVDYVRISRSDISTRKLSFISYDNYLQAYKPTDDTNNSGNYAAPLRVYILPNYTAFGVSPRPNLSEYTVSYNYYTTHTDLSAHGDNMSLPDRFRTLIVDRAKYYTYMLRSDPQHAQLADRDFQRKLRLLKVDYATKNDYMRSDTIAESIATNIGARAN